MRARNPDACACIRLAIQADAISVGVNPDASKAVCLYRDQHANHPPPPHHPLQPRHLDLASPSTRPSSLPLLPAPHVLPFLFFYSAFRRFLSSSHHAPLVPYSFTCRAAVSVAITRCSKTVLYELQIYAMPLVIDTVYFRADTGDLDQPVCIVACLAVHTPVSARIPVRSIWRWWRCWWQARR